MIIRIILLLMIFLIANNRAAWSLPIDEKLSVRVLKTSSTKKTVMFNRGLEDGLVLGDHARFFISSGVIGRGVLVKISPTRSVWSFYRTSLPENLESESVMNLKITAPVKLTNDPTKMFSDNQMADASPQEIYLEERDSMVDSPSSQSRKIVNQMGAMPENLISASVWELWGLIHLNSLSSDNSVGSDGQGTSGSFEQLDLTLGLERYFFSKSRWYRYVSLSPFFQYSRQEITSIEGNRYGTKIMAYGLGISWHFNRPPFELGRFIFYGTFMAGLGIVDDKQVAASDNLIVSSPDLEGKLNFFSIGGGMKYYFNIGLGIRILLDYYRRAETFPISNSTDDYTKVVKGPRLLIGLSYKW